MKEIENLIKANRLHEAIDLLEEKIGMTPFRKAEVIQLKRRLDKAEKNQRLGVVSNENIQIEINQISLALIELLQKQNPDNLKKRNYRWIIFTLVSAVLFFIGFQIFSNGYFNDDSTNNDSKLDTVDTVITEPSIQTPDTPKVLIKKPPAPPPKPVFSGLNGETCLAKKLNDEGYTIKTYASGDSYRVQFSSSVEISESLNRKNRKVFDYDGGELLININENIIATGIKIQRFDSRFINQRDIEKALAEEIVSVSNQNCEKIFQLLKEYVSHE